IFLIPAGMPYLAISRTLIITLAALLGLFSALMVHFVVKSLKSPPFLGNESMKGNVAKVKKDLAPVGVVSCRGELWKARTTGDIIKAGSEVVVEEARGLLLMVRPAGPELHEKDETEKT
ncbi:MAG: NfeD family protein, partial [Vulcanimicrobiota bacterium]